MEDKSSNFNDQKREKEQQVIEDSDKDEIRKVYEWIAGLQASGVLKRKPEVVEVENEESEDHMSTCINIKTEIEDLHEDLDKELEFDNVYATQDLTSVNSEYQTNPLIGQLDIRIPLVKVDYEKVKVKPVDEIFICGECNKVFRKIPLLENHVLRKHASTGSESTS